MKALKLTKIKLLIYLLVTYISWHLQYDSRFPVIDYESTRYVYINNNLFALTDTSLYLISGATTDDYSLLKSIKTKPTSSNIAYFNDNFFYVIFDVSFATYTRSAVCFLKQGSWYNIIDWNDWIPLNSNKINILNYTGNILIVYYITVGYSIFLDFFSYQSDALVFANYEIDNHCLVNPGNTFTCEHWTLESTVFCFYAVGSLIYYIQVDIDNYVSNNYLSPLDSCDQIYAVGQNPEADNPLIIVAYYATTSREMAWIRYEYSSTHNLIVNQNDIRKLNDIASIEGWYRLNNNYFNVIVNSAQILVFTIDGTLISMKEKSNFINAAFLSILPPLNDGVTVVEYIIEGERRIRDLYSSIKCVDHTLWDVHINTDYEFDISNWVQVADWERVGGGNWLISIQSIPSSGDLSGVFNGVEVEVTDWSDGMLFNSIKYTTPNYGGNYTINYYITQVVDDVYYPSVSMICTITYDILARENSPKREEGEWQCDPETSIKWANNTCLRINDNWKGVQNGDTHFYYFCLDLLVDEFYRNTDNILHIYSNMIAHSESIRDETIKILNMNGPNYSYYWLGERQNDKLPETSSIIDWLHCRDKLISHYHLPENSEWLVGVLNIYTGMTMIPKVEYRVYDPTLRTTNMDLSVCQEEEETSFVKISYSLDDRVSSYLSQGHSISSRYGYDIFDASDEFYNDICFPFTSDNNTDITLKDRRIEYFPNVSTCEANCTYLGVDYTVNRTVCLCKIKADGDIHDIKSDDFLNPNGFLNAWPKLNVEIVKCYQLFLNPQVYQNNYGLIIQFLWFLTIISLTIAYFSCKLPMIKRKIIAKHEKLRLMQRRYINNKSKMNSENPHQIRDYKTMQKQIHVNTYWSKWLNINDSSLHWSKTKDFTVKKFFFNNNDSLNHSSAEILNHNSFSKQTNIIANNATSNNDSSIILNINKKIGKGFGSLNGININCIINKPKYNNNSSNSLVQRGDILKNVYKKENTFNGNNVSKEIYILANTFKIKENQIKPEKPFIVKYWNLLRVHHNYLNLIFNKTEYTSRLIKLSFILSSISLTFTLNAMLYGDAYISQNSKNSVHNSIGFILTKQFIKSFYAFWISLFLSLPWYYLCFGLNSVDKKKMKNFQNIKPSEYLACFFKARVKIIIYSSINTLLLLFYIYYATLFCTIYSNSQLSLIISLIISLVFDLGLPFITNFFIIAVDRLCKRYRCIRIRKILKLMKK